MKPKRIELRFSVPDDPSAYQTRSVPIRRHVSICGVEGFAVHAVYLINGGPKKALFKVSHIETGIAITTGPTEEDAVESSEECVSYMGGKDKLLAAIETMRTKLSTMRDINRRSVKHA